MANVDRAYNFVRHELAELGLLADGVYLDKVELCISNVKSSGERGYVFEQVGHYGHTELDTIPWGTRGTPSSRSVRRKHRYWYFDSG